MSVKLEIKHLLEEQDRNILRKVKQHYHTHPLEVCFPSVKEVNYNLQQKGCHRPRINMERFMNTFVNRLIFKL